MGTTKHDKISKYLANKEGTQYNEGKGADIIAHSKIIEVVTHEPDLYSSLDQLRGYRKPKYIATPPELVGKAKEITKGTGVGVMGPTGRIKKRARR